LSAVSVSADSTPTRRQGKVAAFEASAGVGEIDSDGERFAFHCTAIDDGTRLIPVGAAVEFDVVPGPLGRWEAAAITR
jgi:cold shock CspA family protein